MASHCDVLSCHSDIADSHALNVFEGLGRNLQKPLPTLFHSVPEPCFAPNITEKSKLFYIGINWERINGEKGRYHDLLALLDKENLIQIYGPKTFLGVEPWAGFISYSGELPFDGKSVVKSINASGICLVLSSGAHQKSGIMSNRLFEGLAAGAVIIANRNPFIMKYFSDCVYCVDDSLNSAAFASTIRDVVLHIRANVEEARDMAIRAQKRFLESFTLEKGLTDIIQRHPERVAAFIERTAGHDIKTITVIVEYAGLDIDVLLSMLENATRQVRVHVDLLIVCDSRIRETYEDNILEILHGKIASVRYYDDNFCSVDDELDVLPVRVKGTGEQIIAALRDIKTDYFCFMQADDFWFSDHLSSLAFALSKVPKSSFSCSGRIGEIKGNGENLIRHVEELTLSNIWSLADGFFNRNVGRFLYDRSLLADLPTELFAILDGFHYRWFNTKGLLDGNLIQTNYATYVDLRWRIDTLPKPFYDEQEQSAFLRDALRGNPQWIKLSAILQQGQVSGAETVADRGREAVCIRLDHMYSLNAGGDGLDLLRDGFSHPEHEFIWIDGKRGSFTFIVPSDKEALDIALVMGGRNRETDNALQECTLFVNDQKIETFTVKEELALYSVRLPSIESGAARFSLELDHAEPVTSTQGAILDPRKLGLRLAKIGVMKAGAGQEIVSAVKPRTDAVTASKSLIRRLLKRSSRP
ncbi:glycosyltransferase family protein [Acetobacter fallax]|uniref:Glycosyltransferase n=1 Tax=Acetobacter fallax TaxID=1737473 RepID=A0ABX0KD81_9PROT|nr:glycosyltransferase [Acetobacter fallax]NHO34402.1 glycosyltransferase [Acetobacter fallax]NHO37972.1 glycosyltransferase [Acetobacter fallax]